MPRACFVLRGDLDFFRPAGSRRGEIEVEFAPGQTVKHLVESLGIPHVEVASVAANGQPVGFDHLARDGERIEVLPGTPIPPPPPGEARFILDTHLGRLSAYLRLLGFDSLYNDRASDETLAQTAARDGRILLSRDRGLLKRKAVAHGYCPRSDDPRRQAAEVVSRYHLEQAARPFSRCLRCNTPLESVSKATVFASLQPDTRRAYDEFHRCPNCGQIYWRGSHYQKMEALVQELIG